MNTALSINGREPCIAAWRDLLCSLAAAGPRTLYAMDTEFADWPWDEPAVMQALQQWGRLPGRTLHLVAQDFDAVARRHPRLAAWRRDWSHVLRAWRPVPDDRVELPRLLLAGAQAVELLDADRWRARRPGSAEEVQRLVDTCDQLLQRCEPAWPVTTLGL